MADISHTLIAKSDQLNAADLARPIVVTVESVAVVRDDQPVVVNIGDQYQPWKPCKGMRRLLAKAWGTDTDAWVGHRVELYNDLEARWAGKEVGGIRVSGMSGISGGIKYNMRTSKQGHTLYTVGVLENEKPARTIEDERADFLHHMGETHNITEAMIDVFLAPHGQTVQGQKPAGLNRLAQVADKILAAQPAGEPDGGEPEDTDFGS